MKSPSFLASVEPLEARIAPATIFIGGQGGDQYTSEGTAFMDTERSGDPIGAVVGPGVVGTADTFYLKLDKGDLVLRATETGFVPYISGPNGKALGGTVIAFFTDKNSNGAFEVDELTGISLGDKASVQVSGTVFGDVVSNYNSNTGSIGAGNGTPGSATDLLNNSITLFSASSVKGNVISGGDIKSLRITSDVGQVLGGTAANGTTFDFNGTLPDGGDTLVVVAGTGQRGVNISNVSIADLGRLEAGAGGAGALGGNITNVTLVADTNGFTIKAGDGGDGNSSRSNGGNGGKVSGLVINGLRDPSVDPTANDITQVLAGNGGDAQGSSRGGKGGDIVNLAYGFELQNGKLTRSATPLQDAVLVAAGDGGNGKVAGSGGKLIAPRVFAAPTLEANDLVIRAGDGGDNTESGGRAGAGGAITNLEARNPGTSLAAQASTLTVEAGDAGLAVAGARGANGGSLLNADVVAYSMLITAGDGSTGTKGGKGGDVRSLTISDGSQNILARNVEIDAGIGGNGTVSKGGNGGSIDRLTIANADFSNFAINRGGAADGGDSARGRGGAGGSVGSLNIRDSFVNSNEVTMFIRTGNGGDVNTGRGGAGGSFKGNNEIEAINANLVALSGAGGAATSNGSGGAGGAVANLAFTGFGQVAGVGVSASVVAGAGGAGAQGGKGGAGGVLKTVNLNASGAITATAGNGGLTDANGAAGKGGAITTFAALSTGGSVTIDGGDAGAGGKKATSGGALNTVNINAATVISVSSGNGGAGGAGGNITRLGFAGVDTGASPLGSITIVAGDGSGAGNKAGNGGSIVNAVGYVGASGVTLLQAGLGGATAGRGAAGGSITDVSILGGGGVGAELRVQAGDASSTSNAKVGGTGGSVKGLGVDPLENGTIFRRIVAGDGGDNTGGKGGLGGSVINVDVDGDIGVRRGQGFGYSFMGGIFAGLGGSGSSAGAAGSVTGISADAIAAIVAGKVEQGSVIARENLVTQVSGIILNDDIATRTDATGQYTNYDVANLVGAVVNPDQPGANESEPQPHANTFDLEANEFVDNDANGKFSIGDTTNERTDGFIAALSFLNTRKGVNSFRPEALFTLDDLGGVEFIDLNNNNGQQRASLT